MKQCAIDRILAFAYLLAASLLGACGQDTAPGSAAAPSPAAEPETRPEVAIPETGIASVALAPWTGDLDGMIERRYIRVLTNYSRTSFFIDQGTPRGLVPDAFKLFEDDLNKRLKNKNLRVQVVFVPVAHDELVPALLEGRGDIVAAGKLIDRLAQREGRLHQPDAKRNRDRSRSPGQAVAPLADMLRISRARSFTCAPRTPRSASSSASMPSSPPPASRRCASGRHRKSSPTRTCWKWSPRDWCR